MQPDRVRGLWLARQQLLALARVPGVEQRARLVDLALVLDAQLRLEVADVGELGSRGDAQAREAQAVDDLERARRLAIRERVAAHHWCAPVALRRGGALAERAPVAPGGRRLVECVDAGAVEAVAAVFERDDVGRGVATDAEKHSVGVGVGLVLGLGAARQRLEADRAGAGELRGDGLAARSRGWRWSWARPSRPSLT